MNNDHWTDDPELVELFVSGNMRPERKRDLESHLGQCASCRKIVDREAILREGIRIYARNTLKSRLRNRLGHAPISCVPWPHILSAAAVLIIIVGIGIQTRLWKSAEPTLHDADVGQVDSVLIPQYPADDRSGPPREELPPAAESAIENEADEIEEMAAETHLGRERSLEQAQPMTGFAKSQMKQAEGVVWVTGIVLAEEPAAVARSDKKISAAAEEREHFRAPLAQDYEGPRITASQRPVGMLPLAQQTGTLGIQEVVTALEEKNDSLYMTIFTDDRAFQSQELHIKPVTDDSVIVTAGRARIAFKIPAAMKGKIH